MPDEWLSPMNSDMALENARKQRADRGSNTAQDRLADSGVWVRHGFAILLQFFRHEFSRQYT
jgi:hypothetical protein